MAKNASTHSLPRANRFPRANHSPRAGRLPRANCFPWANHFPWANSFSRSILTVLLAGALAVLALGAFAGAADAQGKARGAHVRASHHRGARKHGRLCGRHRGPAHRGLARHGLARHAHCAKASRRRRRAGHPRHAQHSSSPAPTTRLASVPSGPCPGADLTPTAANVAEVRAATLCLVNKQRIQNGETPLVDDGKLDAAAQGHSEDMVAGDYFSHTTPSGIAFDARIDATGYVPSGWAAELGENIECATLGLATPSEAVTSWMNSPEHRANILNGEFRDSGMGIAPAAPAQYAEGQPGATYTQDFGVVAPS